jgi:uncharacterized protein (TIGR02246 family)
MSIPGKVEWFCALLLVAAGASGQQADPPSPSSAATEIEAATQEYASLLKALDATALAAFYTPDGELLEPGMAALKGPKAIQKFLGSFGDVRIESATMASESIEAWGADAIQWGSYAQRVVVPGQPAADFSGRFVAQWTKASKGRWLLRRFLVQPSK